MGGDQIAVQYCHPLERLLNLISAGHCVSATVVCDVLTICHEVFRHVEGDLDGERAGVLRGVDDGHDTRADGDQRQGDLAEWTVSMA